MVDWRATLETAKEKWAQLSKRVRIGVGVALVAVAAAMLFVGLRSSEPPLAVLFSGLSDQDSAEIGERLRASQTPFELRENGTIMVPEARVHELRLMLATENLPSGGSVGFEIFDEQRFGESEFAEQVNYHRALEGELARTISHLAGVDRARVHLVLPERSLFASAEQSASASVALRLRPGFAMSPEQTRGIVHLVASSVRGLVPENVTIVDHRGQRLSRGGDESEIAGTDAIGFTRRVEEEREAAVQQILDSVVGQGHSAVRIAASLGFAAEERTEEHFTPETVATRSFQIQEELDSSASTVTGGVPGAVSNLSGDPVTPGAPENDRVLRRSETRNFEVSKVVTHSVAPIGRIERLSVAVVVDGRYRGNGRARRFVPRSASELTRIESLVANAVGIDTERGDRITVQCIQMAAPSTPVDEAPRSSPRVLVERYSPYVGIALLLLIAGVYVLVRRRRRAREALTKVEVRELPASLGGVPIAKPKELAAAQEALRDSEVKLLGAEIAERDPETSARILRGWLSEDAA